MALHKFLIEHAIWPAMEKRKGKQNPRNPAGAGKKVSIGCGSAAARAADGTAAALQGACSGVWKVFCRTRIPSGGTRMQRCGAFSRWQSGPFRRRQRRIWRTMCRNRRALQTAPAARPENRYAFFMTRAQVESYEGGKMAGARLVRHHAGQPKRHALGSPIELSQQAQLKNRIKGEPFKNRQILSAYHLSEQELAKQVTFLNRYKPEYLYGASILTAFAQMMERRGLSLKITLKAVVSTSETLEPWLGAAAGRVFRCPVANEYGARDAGILAYRCPEGCMHITAENCVIEVLSPKTHEPLGVGKSGVLAVTDLHNFVQPRLRYLLGTLPEFRVKHAAAGGHCHYSRMSRGEDDLLLGHDGALVHGNIIGQLLRRCRAWARSSSGRNRSTKPGCCWSGRHRMR